MFFIIRAGKVYPGLRTAVCNSAACKAAVESSPHGKILVGLMKRKLQDVGFVVVAFTDYCTAYQRSGIRQPARHSSNIDHQHGVFGRSHAPSDM